jgi:hypothetical protein
VRGWGSPGMEHYCARRQQGSVSLAKFYLGKIGEHAFYTSRAKINTCTLASHSLRFCLFMYVAVPAGVAVTLGISAFPSKREMRV